MLILYELWKWNELELEMHVSTSLYLKCIMLKITLFVFYVWQCMHTKDGYHDFIHTSIPWLLDIQRFHLISMYKHSHTPHPNLTVSYQNKICTPIIIWYFYLTVRFCIHWHIKRLKYTLIFSSKKGGGCGRGYSIHRQIGCPQPRWKKMLANIFQMHTSI